MDVEDDTYLHIVYSSMAALTGRGKHGLYVTDHDLTIDRAVFANQDPDPKHGQDEVALTAFTRPFAFAC